MPNTGVVKLTSPVLVQSGSGGGGGCFLLFGLPFVAAGTFLAWRAYAHYDELTFSGPAMPRRVIYVLCSVFVLAGLMLWSAAIHAILRHRRTQRLLRARPDEPWWGDYHWNAKGDRQRPFLGAVGSVVTFGFIVLFLTPFHWWMSADPWIPGFLILGLFDLIFSVVALVWLYRLGQQLKYGAAWIRFERFPFFLGETVDVRLGCRSRLDRFARLIVTLRLVQVQKEQRGNSNDAVGYQHWSERLVFDPAALPDPHELPVSIPLPSDALGSALSEEPPRYWEIDVKGPASGVEMDFEARFLVPVYGRPGGVVATG